MSGRRWATVLGFVVVVVVVGAASVFLGRNEPVDARAFTVSQPDDEQPIAGGADELVVVEASSVDLPPARPLAPLPARDAPLADILPRLKADADAGDRRAACRLGMELLRCQHLGTWSAVLGDMDASEATYEAEGRLAAANAVAEAKLRRLERLRQCQSVPQELRGEGARYVRRAALAGDPYAMLAYAEGQHWPPNGRGIAAGPEFDVWRQEAPGMMQRALQAGNPAAALKLQSHYQDDFGYLAALVPNDAFQGYVYHLLVVRLFGYKEQHFRAQGLDAAAVERARLEAARLHERYFDGKRFPSESAMQYPPYMATQSQDSPGFCEFAP